MNFLPPLSSQVRLITAKWFPTHTKLPTQFESVFTSSRRLPSQTNWICSYLSFKVRLVLVFIMHNALHTISLCVIVVSRKPTHNQPTIRITPQHTHVPYLIRIIPVVVVPDKIVDGFIVSLLARCMLTHLFPGIAVSQFLPVRADSPLLR